MGRVEVATPSLTSMWCSWVPSAAMMKWVPASFKVSLTTTAWAASPGGSSLRAEEGGKAAFQERMEGHRSLLPQERHQLRSDCHCRLTPGSSLYQLNLRCLCVNGDQVSRDRASQKRSSLPLDGHAAGWRGERLQGSSPSLTRWGRRRGRVGRQGCKDPRAKGKGQMLRGWAAQVPAQGF